MTATDAQVRIIVRERQKGRTQEQAAALRMRWVSIQRFIHM